MTIAKLPRTMASRALDWVGRRVYYLNLRGRDWDRSTASGLSAGRHTYGIRREAISFPTGRERLVIGSFCSIATGVRFVFGEHRSDLVSTYPLRTLLARVGGNVDAKAGTIVVGNDVWIGTNALVMSGVNIADGAVVAAGAVVTRDVAAYSIVGGVPAREIRRRFDPETIAALEAIKWWEWPDQMILERMDAFYGPIEEFIRRFGRGDGQQ